MVELFRVSTNTSLKGAAVMIPLMTPPIVSASAMWHVKLEEERREEVALPLIVSKEQKVGCGHGRDSQGERLAR